MAGTRGNEGISWIPILSVAMVVKGVRLTRTSLVPGQAGRAAVAPASLLGFLGSLTHAVVPKVVRCFHDLGGIHLAYLLSLSHCPC